MAAIVAVIYRVGTVLHRERGRGQRGEWCKLYGTPVPIVNACTTWVDGWAQRGV